MAPHRRGDVERHGVNKPPDPAPPPPRILKRPWYRGYPVPFSVYVGPDGTPDFRVTDHTKWEICAYHSTCGICGEKMDAMKFFIGGEKSLYSQTFFDPAMHEECARYSFAVCPFLATPRAYADLSRIKPPPGITLEVHPWGERPKRMGMLVCYDYKIIRIQGQSGLFFKALEVLGIEWQEATNPQTSRPAGL